jgi:uncharacterized protein YktA (UPF0223 family)
MNWKAYFTDDDKAKIIKFLNLVSKHAEWKLSTEDLIEVYKHLHFMQSSIIPKIDSNILEIKQIIENKEKVNTEVSRDE